MWHNDPEKRQFTRVPFRSEAGVKSREGIVVRGEIKDLSLNGVFLRSSERTIPSGEAVEVNVLLSGTTSELSINMKGNIVRLTDEGMAVQFLGMDLDAFIHLKNIVSYYSGNEDAVLEEFLAFMRRNRIEIEVDENGSMML